MEKILISRCLLGDRVRYNAECFDTVPDTIRTWQVEGRLVPICPEVDGGLAVPRPAAEILASDRALGGAAVWDGQAQVLTEHGEDVSAAFIRGAERALLLAIEHEARIAVLKARSPSCGARQIYDGSFSRRAIDGMGVTAALLSRHGIRVFDETQLDEVSEWLSPFSPVS